jgi:hypothetical protein
MASSPLLMPRLVSAIVELAVRPPKQGSYYWWEGKQLPPKCKSLAYYSQLPQSISDKKQETEYVTTNDHFPIKSTTGDKNVPNARWDQPKNYP